MDPILPQQITAFFHANYWGWQLLVIGIAVMAVLLIGRTRFAAVIDRSAAIASVGDGRNAVFVVVASLALFLFLTFMSGIPQPSTHDEFCYLFAADTFAHGRLANPTPVSPRSFESFHILVEPVYASKYPPMQGAFLALGKLVTGYPIAGVWLSSILAALSIYWLLRAFFSMQWVLFGTLLWVASPLNAIWSSSYWGAHVAVLGGALSLGAFFHLLRSRRVAYAFAWGIGVFLLLNSRPYEGVVLTAVLGLLYLVHLYRKKLNPGIRILAALALCVAGTFAFIGLYNNTVTGDPFMLPYALQHEQYHRTPLFVFQPIAEPKLQAPEFIANLDARWTSELERDYGSVASALKTTVNRILMFPAWVTRSPLLLGLLIIGIVIALRRRSADDVFVLIVAMAVTSALLLTTFTGDRFISPIVALAVVLMTSGAKRAYEGSGLWKPLIAIIPLIVAVGYLSGVAASEVARTRALEGSSIERDGFRSRADIEQSLRASEGKDLIFVESASANAADPRFYVYNEADIDSADVIWAHKLDDGANRIVIERFTSRNVWLLRNVEGKVLLERFTPDE